MEDNKFRFSVISTTSSRLSDLPISDGQLIFVKDIQRIAMDSRGSRIFYNQIITLDTESDRTSLESPVENGFYFVIGTAVMWHYSDSTWNQISGTPQNVIFIGTELPELGSENELFVDTTNKEISVWNKEEQSYVIVSDKTDDITDDDITELF